MHTMGRAEVKEGFVTENRCTTLKWGAERVVVNILYQNGRAKTERTEFTTSRRILTKVHRWFADTPQSFMHFQAATLEYSHRVEGNTGWCTISQSHPIPHCKPTHSCNPMQFCVCVSTLPSRRKEVLECLIQFHSNVQHGADGHAVIRVLPANLSHTSSENLTLTIPRAFSIDLVFLLPGSMPKNWYDWVIAISETLSLSRMTSKFRVRGYLLPSRTAYLPTGLAANGRLNNHRTSINPGAKSN